MERVNGSGNSTLVFFVNGKKVVEKNPNPEWSLLFYLRNKLGIRGPKEGCGEGGCGACTVMLSKLDRASKHISHYSLNACLTPVVAVHGLSVVTTEGIGSTRSRLHPVQERLAKSHGSQCGFCTPGFVMSMYSLLRNCHQPTIQEIEENLAGNLCRCTGYRPILEGFSSFSSESFRPGCGETECCRAQGEEKTKQGERSLLYDVREFSPLDQSQEIIFPPELMIDDRYDSEDLCFPGQRTTWHRPTSLETLIEIRSSYPEAAIVIGNTEVGIMRKSQQIVPTVQIDPSKVKELFCVTVCKSGVILGAGLCLTKVEDELKKVVQNLPEWKTRGVRSLLEMLRWFGSKQIKNAASLGGNIMSASPVSDLNPVLVSVEAQLKFKSKNDTRKVTLDSSFFAGYRKTAAKSYEVLLDVFIPFTDKNIFVESFKQSRRRTDDVAIVNAGFKAEFVSGTKRVDRAIFSFGGMAEKTVVASNVMQNVQGKDWNEALLEESLNLLLEDLPLASSAPGGMVQYRRTLSLSFFFKFFMNTSRFLESIDLSSENGQLQNEPNLASKFYRPPAQGYQSFETADAGPIGLPVVHSSAYKHATGEAAFVDDLPRQEKEIAGALVLSEKASAKILRVDSEDASNVPGFVGFYCAKDIGGEQNKTGVVEEDEEVFASEEVKYAGEVIGIVVGESIQAAKEAARRVIVSYEEKKPILTIENALEAKSEWPTRRVRSGDVEVGFREADHTLEGEIRVGGQEHFYMETQTSLVVPMETGDMEVWSATQNPSETQRNVAKALGVPLNKIVCRIRRLGGGFGGKEIKSGRIATYAAVAASKTGRPVRLTLDRDVDVRTTGGRHPMLAKWKAGFNSDGSLVALRVQMFANGGYSLDVSDAMAVKAILHADNVYRIPNTDIGCTCCRTNLASNTACRGTGAPQSMLIMEDIITRVSAFLGRPPHEIRSLNMHQTPNPVTHYGQTLTHCTVKRCWEEVLRQSDFFRRRQDIAEFNKKNAFTKRGICAVPSKMAVSFGLKVLEQAGAMVHIYKDGSVLLSHAGVEMGQGLHTKMIQVAAKELGVPVESVNLMETSTDKIPNTSPTAASSSSDLNGMAVKAACQQLLERLEPYRRRNPAGGWGDWVMSAYEDRVSLLGTGFYKTPGLLDFDFEKRNFGDHYTYFTFGAAVTEVEVDILTGNHTVLQTDIVMDAGQSLNPAVDVGQIEGAFMFGYGLYTLEEMLYDQKGKPLTVGPNTYKLPSIQDIPCKFNVSLLKNSSNPRAIYSSRGVGEPPLFLASSAFFAIKDALSSALSSTELGAHFRLDSPATAERIRMATKDKFSQLVSESTFDSASDEVWCIRV